MQINKSPKTVRADSLKVGDTCTYCNSEYIIVSAGAGTSLNTPGFNIHVLRLPDGVVAALKGEHLVAPTLATVTIAPLA